MKKLLIGILIGLGFVATTALAQSIFSPRQGGTGIGSTGAGNIGKCLSVSAVSPFTYTFSDCVGGSGAVANGIDGYVTRYTGTSTIATGILIDNGTVAGVNASSSTSSFNIQGSGALNALRVASSTGNALFTIAPNGSTTITSLGTGPVYSSTGALYTNGTTGTGLTVQATSPTLVTPILGVASGTALTLSNNLWVSGTLNVTGTSTLATTSIPALSNLTSNGFVKTSGGNGLLSVDTSTYLTGNQTITLSGDVSGSGTTGITTTIGNDKVTEAMLKVVDTPTDEDILTYESTTGDFEWHTPAQLSLPTYTYASSSYVHLWNLQAGSNITITTSSVPTIAVSSTPTFTTLSTGQGQYELYAMNQDVLTSSNVTFNTLTVTATTTLSAATTTINGVNYYWPSAQSVGTKILQNDGTGQLSWVADQTGGGGSLSGGTVGFAAIWASSTSVTIGTLRDNGTVSGVNATSSTVSFNIQGTTTLNPFNVSSSTGNSIFQVSVNSRVGINTTTPEATLTVQGISSSPTVEPFVIASSSGQQLLVVLPSGKVGIGSNISNPFTRLQVGNSNEITATPSQLFFGEYSNSSGWPTFLGNWTSTGLWAFGPDSGSADNVLRIGVTPGNSQGWSVNQSAFKVAIGDSVFGNSVGIGSTSPIATLVVKGTSTSPTVSPLIIASSTGVSMFQIASNGSTTLSSLGTGCVGVSSGSLYTTSCGGAGTIDGSGAPGLVTTWSDADTLTTGLFRDNGTVAGINATSSTVLFNVQGTSGSTNNIFNISSSTGISILTATSNQRIGIGSSTPVSTLVVQGTSTYPTIYPLTVASSSGASLFVVTNAGKVGIGTNTPTSLFTVDAGTAYGTASSTVNIPQKFQIDTYNSAGSRVCMVIVGTTLTIFTGACP